MDSKTAARQGFLPLMQELVRTYQAFAAYDANGYRDVDLTVPQADVLFTLGNTDGLTFKEIGDKTLITKGKDSEIWAASFSRTYVDNLLCF